MWDLRPTLISRKDTPWFPNQSLSGKQAWKSSTLPHATSAYPLSCQNFIVEELEHKEQDTTEKCVSSSDHRVLSNITTKKLRSWHPAPSLHDKQTGKICKQWQTLFSWAPKSLWTVTAAMKVKDASSMGKKPMTNLDSILKSRDVTLLTKVQTAKATVFPAVMYGYESWTIKKAEHLRIDAFKLWCWRRLLRVPWTAEASKPSQS